MLSCRNQFAVVYDADLVGVHNRGQLMGDNNQSLVLHQLRNRRLHLLLIFGVSVGGGLVKHHNRGVLQDGTGQRNTLALTAGEHLARIPRHGVDTLGQLLQKLHTLGFPRRLQDLLIGSVQPSNADILQQRGVEQVLILRHIGNTAVQRLQAHVTQFLSADGDAAFLRVIVVDQQFCQSALA